MCKNTTFFQTNKFFFRKSANYAMSPAYNHQCKSTDETLFPPPIIKGDFYECMLISNTQHEYAALIPRTRELNVMATVMEYPFNCIMQPLVDQYKEWIDCEYVALVGTDPKQWNIPAGTDTKDYWTPILCSNRGLGFAPYKRIKNVITPQVGMDYHPMTEQEAWRFVNNELLKA